MKVSGAFVTTAIFLTLLPSCLPIPAIMVRMPRTIRLVDSRTERPIEGAVVLRSWHKCDAAFPAGGSCSDFTFREVRSDAAGRSWFPPEFKPYLNQLLIPIVWWNWTEEKPLLVFKAGYETILEQPGAPLFRLEKIPDSYWRRFEELESARAYGYVDDVRTTKFLKDALEQEAEEISLLPRDVPGVFYHGGIRPPRQGGSLRIIDAALDGGGMHYLVANGPPSFSILSASGAWTGVKVELPWGTNISSVASDETGRVFAINGGKLMRVSANGRHDTVGTAHGRPGRFLVHGQDIFLIEKRPDYADPNPPRAVPVLYRYDFGEKLICQSTKEPDFVFRDLALSADRESILVVAGTSPFIESRAADRGSFLIRYDLACQKLFSCRLPNARSDDPALSVAALPHGGFVVATEDRFSVHSDDCTVVFEETFAGRDVGRVFISRVRAAASGDRVYFVDLHYGRVLVYDLKNRVFQAQPK